MCPSSNYFTLSLQSLDNHPTLPNWLSLQYPISISTDDSGVFNASLTSELAWVYDTFARSSNINNNTSETSSPETSEQVTDMENQLQLQLQLQLPSLSFLKLVDMIETSISYTFSSENEKLYLMNELRSWKATHATSLLHYTYIIDM